MNYRSVQDFNAQRLPEILAGRDRLQALFATYNRVGGHESGPVKTGYPDLGITVQNGDLRVSNGVVFGLILGSAPQSDEHREIGQLAVAELHAEGEDVQRTLEGRIALPAETDELLTVIYAGLSAFDGAVSFARRLRREGPKRLVVVLTCDCNLREKLRDLDPLQQAGEITEVLVSRECGGHGDMARILDALIAAWPNRART